MSLPSFHTLPTWAMALSLAANLLAGIGIGIVYFGFVWRHARLLASGGPAGAAIALIASRLVLLGGFLALATIEGALPLLAMALGILIGRPIFMRCLGEIAN